ncbi:MAG TPA: hypothetical protein VIP09_09575 [Dehalococcoidia bacterium]
MPQTGPNSRRAKAVSRRNSWKHGIRSYAIVLSKAEDPVDWEEHVAGIFESLQPEGHLESMLAERVAINLWKMRRIDHFQNIATIRNMSKAYADLQLAAAGRQGTLGKGGKYPDIPEDEYNLAQALRVLPTTDDLEKIMRYEAHLHRQYIQTLHELEAIQIRRKGGTSPLARLDIIGAPGG